MLDLPLTVILILVLASTVGAGVNGALGYGFSSIVVPSSLTVMSPRRLNPTLVMLEVALNGAALISHRRTVRLVWSRVWPVVIGLVPGVAVGGVLFGLIAVAVLKTGTYALILPLVALQSFAWRWPVRSVRRAGPPFGFGLGVLYATTTVSGPPLAIYFNNLGLAQDEFRAALAVVRVIEAVTTLVVYALVGALTVPAAGLAVLLLPVVVLGLALGRRVIARVDRAKFARVCMRVDAVLVTIGLAITISHAGWLAPAAAWPVATGFALALHAWAATRARRVARREATSSMVVPAGARA